MNNDLSSMNETAAPPPEFEDTKLAGLPVDKNNWATVDILLLTSKSASQGPS
jgi:hypothetical protein